MIDRITSSALILAALAIGYMMGERPWRNEAVVPLEQQTTNRQMIQALNQHELRLKKLEEPQLKVTPNERKN